MDNEQLISEAMRLLGSRTSKDKAEASRRNGKLGGRPKTKRIGKKSAKSAKLRKLSKNKVLA